MLSQFCRFTLKYLLLGHLYVSSCYVFDSCGDTSPCITKGWCSRFIRGKGCCGEEYWFDRIGISCTRSKIIIFGVFFFLIFSYFYSHKNNSGSSKKQTNKPAQFNKKLNIVEFKFCIRRIKTKVTVYHN